MSKYGISLATKFKRDLLQCRFLEEMMHISRFISSFTLILALYFPTTSYAADTPALSSPRPPLTDLFTVMRLPSNITLYNIALREFKGTTTDSGKGLYQTCDSSEIALGAFCEEVENNGKDGTGALISNALLSSGTATLRSAVCKWKNPGQYRVVATCASVRAVVGDSTQGIYDPDQPGDVK